jgi:hypothetical protein
VKGLWSLRDNIYECVCCFNHCHGNAVKGFEALFHLSVCWLLGDHLLLRDFEMYNGVCVCVSYNH